MWYLFSTHNKHTVDNKLQVTHYRI